MVDENKRLIPMTITHTDDNNWRITVEGEDSYFVKCDIEDIKKVCRRIKAKDGENNNKCRSAKVGTYLSMVSDSDSKEHKINVWKSKVPHTADDFKKLMESKEDEMKTVKLTKNYIIEGVIVPKGTVLSLKENEMKFIPTDLWNKVKDVADKSEKIEIISKEVGDEFSKEEIEDFVNKNLKESLMEEVEGLDDMIEMISETIESEDYVDPKNYDKVIEKAKKDKELLKAWEELSNADDKSFNKKENAFWNRFDAICKEYKKSDKKTKEEK